MLGRTVYKSCTADNPSKVHQLMLTNFYALSQMEPAWVRVEMLPDADERCIDALLLPNCFNLDTLWNIGKLMGENSPRLFTTHSLLSLKESGMCSTNASEKKYSRYSPFLLLGSR